MAAEQEKIAKEDAKRRQADLEREQHEAEEQRRAVERELGVGERTRETWEAVKALLQEREEFSIAFHSTFLLPLNGRMATLATAVPFFSKMIEKHSDALRAALTEVSGRGDRHHRGPDLRADGYGGGVERALSRSEVVPNERREVAGAVRMERRKYNYICAA